MPEMPKTKYIAGIIVVTCVLIAIIVPLAVLLPQDNDTKAPESSAMKQMLDSMENLMTGGSEFDPAYYSKLRTCMRYFDDRLPDAQDGAWQGMIDYWDMGGALDDPWGGSRLRYTENCQTISNLDNPNLRYLEDCATVTNLHGMVIYEPCNYASNVAYYHDVTELCSYLNETQPLYSLEYLKAFGKSFSSLAVGSSFMHGSHTELGHQLDIIPISIVAYLIHQGSLSAIANASPILTDLSETPRLNTSVELSEDFIEMYLSMPVVDWYDHMMGLDIPNYYLLFTGIFSTALTIAFEPDVVDLYLPPLCEFFGVPEAFVNFTSQLYLPELRNATVGLNLRPIERINFLKNTLGAVVKLVYSLLWQEEVLVDDNVENPILLNEAVNIKGWELLPKVNSAVNSFNKFNYTDDDFQKGINIYPGDVDCNPTGPHAKWHLESAVGLLDLVLVGDEMKRIISKVNNY